MGVPGFYSWLTKRYPLIKHMVGKHSLPQIDYLYLDMNGIIYKCVKDDSVIFKSQIMPKEFEQIWVQVFNYINMIVNLLKPNKMIYLALDGVAPRSKMNNQRSRRFKSARDYKQFIQRFYGYSQSCDSQQNFKNNSISPGTKFMQQLNLMISFFIQKKISQDDYWKNISIIFTGSDCPGQGQHKIMEWIRANQSQFGPDDTHCLYGADADLIMLGLVLPMKNVCIIREEYLHYGDKVKIKDSKKEKVVQFQLIFLSILREYFDVQYKEIRNKLQHLTYDISSIIKDFVFLFFFIGNDFLPRCLAYNIRQRSIEKLIQAFKTFLTNAQHYVTIGTQINMKQLARLVNQVAKYQSDFIQQKADQATNYLQKKIQFQDQFTKSMSLKIKKQSQFLNLLKQFYLNQDPTMRSSFYLCKFSIQPEKQIQEFYSILGFYLHGLKFVWEYYFKNLSSWSWYYPFYYAPLLSDVAFYLNYIAETGTKLEDLDKGKPFNPFQQLLCILPKESCDLLPESFKGYLRDTTSPLRTPFDFYPDQFEDDLYGSTRSHEAVSLIPFLNQEIIEQAYKQAIKKVDQSDLRRNQFQKTRLYEYNPKGAQVQVLPPLSTISPFTCPIVITQIQLQSPCVWKTTISPAYPANTIRLPTLHMKSHTSQPQSNKHALKYIIQLTQPQSLQIKLGNAIYYGYPLEHSGRVEAILTKDSFQMIHQFQARNYALDRISRDYQEVHQVQKRKKELFQDLLGQFRRKDFANLNLNNVHALVFVIDTQYFNRTLNGAFQRVYTLQNNQKTYEIVPLSMVSKNKKYDTTKSDFKYKNLQQQFPLGTQVLLTHPDPTLCGSKAKVTGYSQQKVTIQPIFTLSRIKPNILTKIVNTDEIFLDIRFVSQIIGMKHDIILTILDTVSISLPKQKNLPDSIDIGLNFISRYDSKLVPNLVRINFDKKYVQDQDRKKVFKYLQLSVKAFQMLLQYKKKYPEVLQFITARHYKLVAEAKAIQKPINWKEIIRAEDIYMEDGKSQGKHQEITKNLMKVYLWLIKNIQTHMPMSSIYSKQISFKKIRKLQQHFKQQLTKKPLPVSSTSLSIDPNFLYSLQHSRKGFLYLSQRPSDHTIGDEIICLHPQHFGHYGIIIGNDDDRYEVIFQKPSFGKGDLNGLCDNLWGGKFRYKDLMNLDTWAKCFKQRIQTKKVLENKGWVDSMTPFMPRFKSNPIKNFNDFQMFAKNQTISKAFDPATIAQVLRIKASLNQVVIDKDYQIVDNAKQDHLYKFDKRVTTMTQKQVQQLGKNKKWLQKKSTQIKNQDFQRQIIQNKLQNLIISQPVVAIPIPKVKSTVSNTNGKKAKYVQKPIQSKVITNNGEFGEEEDAEDILG